MSEKNRNIDELFRQELGNTTEAPPSSVWDALEQRLDQESKPGSRNPYLLPGLLFLLAALVAAYVILHNRSSKNTDKTKTTDITVIQARQAPAGAPGLPVEGKTGVSDHTLHQNQADTLTETVIAKQLPGKESRSTSGDSSAQNKQHRSGRKQSKAPLSQKLPAADQPEDDRLAGTGDGKQQETAKAFIPKRKKTTGTPTEDSSSNSAVSVAAAAKTPGSQPPKEAKNVSVTAEQPISAARKSTTAPQQNIPKPSSANKGAAGIQQNGAEAKAAIAAKTDQRPGTKRNTATVKTTAGPHDDLALASGTKRSTDTQASVLAKNTVEKTKATVASKTTLALDSGTKRKSIAAKPNIKHYDDPAPAAGTKRSTDTRASVLAKNTVEKTKTTVASKTTQALDSGTKRKSAAAKPSIKHYDDPAPAAGTRRSTDTRTSVLAKNNIEKTKATVAGKTTQALDSGTKSKTFAGKAPKQSEKPVPAATASKQQNTQKAPVQTDSAKLAAVSKELLTQTANGAKELLKDKEISGKAGRYSKDSFATSRQTLPQSTNMKKTAASLPTAGTTTAKVTPKAKNQAEAKPKVLPQSGKQQETNKKEETEQSDNTEDDEEETPATGNMSGSGNEGSPKTVKHKDRRSLNMSIGVKAAYERGFQSYTANTLIGSIFGEVHFSERISFILQPGIRLAGTSSEYRTMAGTYIRAGDVKSTMYYQELDSISNPTGYKNYAYSQTYDSIVAYQRAQKRFTEIELPFMVRYKMDKNLSFLAGMQFTFGKTLKMEGELQTYSGLSLTDSIFHHYDTAGITPPAPGKFSHPGSTPFSAYKDPGATELINLIRFGYTIGLSYTAQQRLIVDLTLQQSLSRLTDINDRQIKKLFTQPYIRLSVGYSIFGRRK